MANKAKKDAPVKPKRAYTKRNTKKDKQATRKSKDSSKSDLRIHGRVLAPEAVQPLTLPEGLELYKIRNDIAPPVRTGATESYTKLAPLISEMKVNEYITVLKHEREIFARINKERQLGFIFRYSYTDNSKKFVRIHRVK